MIDDVIYWMFRWGDHLYYFDFSNIIIIENEIIKNTENLSMQISNNTEFKEHSNKYVKTKILYKRNIEKFKKGGSFIKKNKKIWVLLFIFYLKVYTIINIFRVLGI
jgi:hypothetical protein